LDQVSKDKVSKDDLDKVSKVDLELETLIQRSIDEV